MSNPNRSPYQTLTEALEELERDDSGVRAVVEKHEREAWRRDLKKRIADRRASAGPKEGERG